MIKKIPYGISEFKDIIQENYYFVDKTKYIEKLENLNEKYIVHLRPRRFGKSLFISMLEYYYDIKNKEENTKLFDGLFIGDNPTPKQGSYYILKFDFSGVVSNDLNDIQSIFNIKVASSIKKFIEKYSINNIDLDYDLPNAAILLSTFFDQIENKITNKIYIMIDEYDHFANDLLGKNYNFFKQSVSSSGFVRSFYEVIKIGTTSIIDRIFITGVSPLTLDSFTSGFNISSDRTRSFTFNEMLGFTKDEVIKLCENVIYDKSFDINKKLAEFKKNYNGYSFSEDGNETVYNSDMILYYLNQYNELNKEPKNIISTNIHSDLAKIEGLFNLGGFDQQKLKVLEDILMENDITTRITEKFNLEGDFTISDFKSQLFYLGFLTISKVDKLNRVYLKSPNYVIKEIYFDFLYSIIKKNSTTQLNYDNILDSVGTFSMRGDIKPLVKDVENIFNKLSNRDFIKFDEKYIKIVMLSLLFKSEIYLVKSEYEVENGYIDIALFNNSRVHPDYYGIFELKYISKKDYNEELLHEKLEEGKEQILKYTFSDELKLMKNLKKFVLVFSGAECKRIKEI